MSEINSLSENSKELDQKKETDIQQPPGQLTDQSESIDLEECFQEVYSKFKLNFYRGIFDRVSDRLGSLNVTEAFAAEAIYALREPKIGEFAEAIGISQPNATYKVNSLIKKGYIKKINSKKDKREYHLRVTQKFLDYYNINSEYVHTVMERIKERFTPEQTAFFTEMLRIISRDLMPENSQIHNRNVMVDET
ncbi:MAG: MarR family winged helix-turn-helix transcriptional regulator [Eubacteriales bacterium]